ncbi:hypothetical protein MMC30_007668 [Trapelia coarctata]|nr:hypothetical protein [Trapelia coarctata]
MASQVPKSESLGTVLVIGGCGFLGYHLIHTLLQDPACGPIFAVSRRPNVNLHEGVTYLAGDATDAAGVKALFEKIQPRVIFHAASPRPNDTGATKYKAFHDTNVTGTKNLLTAAVAAPSVKAFVLTSSITVYSGKEHIDLDENAPMWQPGSEGTFYDITKSLADMLVRKANGRDLQTVTLRLCLVVGERDNSFVPGLIGVRTNVQLGDNINLMDATSASNAANAHVLAAKALLEPSRAMGPVAGEAFNITDGNPVPFWDLSRMIWRPAGTFTPVEKVNVLPVWFAISLATVTEWMFLICTLGRRKPEAMNKLVVSYCVRTHSYSIEKARKVLGYNPLSDLEKEIERSVKWEMQRRQGGEIKL